MSKVTYIYIYYIIEIYIYIFVRGAIHENNQ